MLFAAVPVDAAAFVVAAEKASASGSVFIPMRHPAVDMEEGLLL